MNGDGLHVNLGRCELNIAGNSKELKKVIDELVVLTGLKKLGKVELRVGASYLPGVSMVQIIETSHIAIHGFTINSCYDITIVSCAPFKVKKVMDYLKKTFKPKKVRSQSFKVDTMYPVTTDGKV